MAIERTTPMIITGGFLTSMIRSGRLDPTDPSISDMTPEQHAAIKSGKAKIEGDTHEGLRIVGKW
jgi:hypothetical protein